MLTNSLELGGKSLEVRALGYWRCLRKSSSLLVSSSFTFLSARFLVSFVCFAPIRLPRPLILFMSDTRRLEDRPEAARLALRSIQSKTGAIATWHV